MILRIRDLSEQTQLEEQLDRLVSRDPITGVANRAQLEAHLDRAVQRRAEAGGLAAVLLVDLDDFRAVSDTLGHDAGDDLLRQTAMRLERAAAQGDLVARIDGDTFGVLLDHLESVEHGRARSHEILDGLRGEITLSGGHLVQLDAYCGLAFGATDLPARELIRHADIALLELSERGTPGVSLFTDQMQQRVSDRVASPASYAAPRRAPNSRSTTSRSSIWRRARRWRPRRSCDGCTLSAVASPQQRSSSSQSRRASSGAWESRCFAPHARRRLSSFVNTPERWST